VNNARIVTYIQNEIETRVYLELMSNKHLFVRRYFHIQNVQQTACCRALQEEEEEEEEQAEEEQEEEEQEEEL